MNKSALRLFIRESLRGSADHLLSEVDESGPKKKSFVGLRFSSEEEGDPEITVIAENLSTSTVVFIPYPIADASTDREESDYTTTESVLMKRFDAQMMPNDADIINQIFNNAAGWTSLSGIYPVLTPFFDSAKRRRLDFVPNVLMASRTPALLKKPASYSTRSAPKRAEEFECVLPMSEVIDTTFGGRFGLKGYLTPISSPKWALAAACYYAYANSPKGAIFAALVGGVIGGVLLSETGPFALAGFLAGASLSSVSYDVVLRLPVMMWAHFNKKYKFLAANVLYVVIIILFESWMHFKEVKALYQAEKAVGRGVVTQYSNRFYNLVMKKLAPTGALEVSDDVLKQSFLGLLKGSDKFFTDDEIRLAIESARTLDFWSPTKIIIVGFAMQILAWMFGDETARSCKNELMALIEEGDLDPERLSETEEFKKYIENRFPEI